MNHPIYVRLFQLLSDLSIGPTARKGVSDVKRRGTVSKESRLPGQVDALHPTPVGWWRRRKRVLPIWLLSILVVFSAIAVLYYQPRFIVRWIAARDSRVLYFVETDRKVVALTIDDGPHPTVTPALMDVLKSHEARATFFLIGERIKGNEHLLNRMKQEGHELGNHFMSDRPSILLPADQFQKELLAVDEMLGDAPVKLCRPGSGWYNDRMLEQIESHGYRCVLGSVYPHDTAVRNTAIISSYIESQVYPGSIIILHDGTNDRKRTIRVLEEVLPALKREGYQVVTVSELVARK